MLRPDGGMIAKRDRWPRPIARRLRQLHDRLEVPQWTGRGFAHDRPAIELRWTELGGHVAQRRLRHFAQIEDPLADLSQRKPHQPAAALASGAPQGDPPSERAQICRAIVDGRARMNAGARAYPRHAFGLTDRYAAHGLHHRVEAAPRRPWAGMAEGTKRYIDKPWPDP